MSANELFSGQNIYIHCKNEMLKKYAEILVAPEVVRNKYDTGLVASSSANLSVQQPDRDPPPQALGRVDHTQKRVRARDETIKGRL